MLCFIVMPLHFSFGQPGVGGAAGWLFAALGGSDRGLAAGAGGVGGFGLVSALIAASLRWVAWSLV